jgi:starch phosphorylase
VNGVAERHREVSAAMFPAHRISAITNGVHSYTWTSEPFRRLFDEHLPGWAAEPLLLARVEAIPDAQVWEAHQAAKRTLLAEVRAATGASLDERTLTIGFARRFTPYKRPMLLFSDIARLRNVTRSGPLQVVLAGKAHPRDDQGKRLIRDVLRIGHDLGDDRLRVVFLPDYDLASAARLVAGVDVWLNTPQPPLEASGTSGMKAAHNGVLNFSVLDGWWIEGHREGVTGWSIGPGAHETVEPAERLRHEVDDLYGKLEYVVLPTYYRRPDEWARMMKQSIDDLASYFNTHRMLRRYVTDAYFPRH